jgi:DNA invertase Pin-like site-specific DNA recombinase
MKTLTHRRKQAGNPAIGVALMRVSTDEQHLGPEAQRAAIMSWADREGVKIVACHLESGVSGATPLEQRTVLLRAIDDVKAYRAGHLVIAKRDRIGRDVVIVAAIERLVERCGARLTAADGTSANNGPEGLLLRGIIDVFAQYERLLIASRTRAALAAKRAKGERAGAVPFGFTLADDRRTLVDCPKERDVIDFVRRRRREGVSFRAIVAECELNGFTSRTGRPFALRQVALMARDAR